MKIVIYCVIIFIAALLLIKISFNKNDSKNKKVGIKSLVNLIFKYRYGISLSIINLIILFGIYLYFGKHWTFKDATQVCGGFFIVITLFFTALNYEFSASKTKNDIIAARNILTFNTANEWHKQPITQFEKNIIKFETKFIASKSVRNVGDFVLFFKQEENADYREAFKGILNHLETISIGVEKKLIDSEFMKEFHMGIFKAYYIDYFFFIDYRRKEKNDYKIWLKFTNLAEEWNPEIKQNLIDGLEKSSVIT